MRDLLNKLADAAGKHFGERASYLDLLMRLRTTAEEWFRVEFLGVLIQLNGVSIAGTNQQTQNSKERPDFSLKVAGLTRLIELKVLPQDQNYPYGWQRFQASRNNKYDFSNLAEGFRDAIVYVYWPDKEDWTKCRANIEKAYHVSCIRQDEIKCETGYVVFSYWVAKDNARQALLADRS